MRFPSPQKGTPRPNEDTEFRRRMLRAGERLLYEPDAVIYHPIMQSRLKKGYFCRWWFDYGRAMVRESGKRPDLFGIPGDYASVLRCGVRLSIETFRWTLATHPQNRLWHRCLAWGASGHMRELWNRVGHKKQTVQQETPSPVLLFRGGSVPHAPVES
jgi:hypothetical protein